MYASDAKAIGYNEQSYNFYQHFIKSSYLIEVLLVKISEATKAPLHNN